MIKVEIRYKDDSVGVCVCVLDDLFMLVWSLNSSEYVKEIRVEGTLPSGYGWGKIEKWVTKFNWNKKDIL